MQELIEMAAALECNIKGFLQDNHTLHPAHARDIERFREAAFYLVAIAYELHPSEEAEALLRQNYNLLHQDTREFVEDMLKVGIDAPA